MQGAVLAVKPDGRGRVVGALDHFDLVAHARQLGAGEGRHQGRHLQPPWSGLVGTEGALHMVADDVMGLRRLLHVHVELDHVEKKLQQVLVLAVAALYGKGH